VHHLNLKSMGMVHGNGKLLRRHAFIVVQRYVDLFPTWVGIDLFTPYNPLNVSNNYKQIRSIDPKCASAFKT
jgi:hypothetical protein